MEVFMLITSQPLGVELSEKYERKSKAEREAMTDLNIQSQYIGYMFDGLLEKVKYIVYDVIENDVGFKGEVKMRIEMDCTVNMGVFEGISV